MRQRLPRYHIVCLVGGVPLGWRSPEECRGSQGYVVTGRYESVDWTTGLDYWTGLLDSPKSFPNSFPDNNIGCVSCHRVQSSDDERLSPLQVSQVLISTQGHVSQPWSRSTTLLLSHKSGLRTELVPRSLSW